MLCKLLVTLVLLSANYYCQTEISFLYYIDNKCTGMCLLSRLPDFGMHMII